MSIIINAGGGGISSGEYIWRRYTISSQTLTVDNPAITLTNTDITTQYKVTSNDVDMSIVSVDFFEGFKPGGLGGLPHFERDASGDVCFVHNGEYIKISYDPSTQVLSVNKDIYVGDYYYSDLKEYTATVKEFTDYITDSDSDKYPQSGELGKYWYEFGTGGKYLWKKYEYIENAPCVLSFTQLTDNVNPTQLKVTSDVGDLSTVDESLFVGLKGTFYTSSNFEYEFQKNGVFKIITNNITTTWSYEPSTQILSIGTSMFLTSITWHDINTTITGYGNPIYVASNSSTEYPSGEHEGYWYESVEANSSIVHIESKIVSASTKSIVITIPENYDMNKIAILFAKPCGVTITMTKDEANRTFTINITNTVFPSYYDVYYVPNCKEVVLYGVNIKTNQSITTKCTESESFILLPHIKDTTYHTYDIRCTRTNKSLEISSSNNNGTATVLSEVVF